MEAWIPLFQSLIWPVFIAIILLCARKWFMETLEVIKGRIAAGSILQVGPGGITVGTAPKLESEDQAELLAKVESQIAKDKPAEEEAMPLELVQSLYLIHSVKPYREMQGRPYYSINVQLNADSPVIMDRVSKVTYYLHPTFPDPVREITDQRKNFELSTLGWGQFNLRADVYFKDRKQPLTLFRYLNF